MEGASNVLLSWYNNIDDDVSSFPEFGKCQKINPSFSRRWTFDRYYKLPSAKKFIIVLQSTLRLQQTLKKCILFGLAAWIGSCICAYLHNQKHGHMWILVVWYSKDWLYLHTFSNTFTTYVRWDFYKNVYYPLWTL